MNVCLYMRISTTGQTIEPQRAELRAYCKSKGWEISAEYSDVISGSKAARKGLDALMRDIDAGKVKAVMAVKIDRIARSMSHFSKLIEDFAKKKVALIIPGQGIDTSSSNPVGTLLLNLLGVLAEFERGLIVERTLAGLAHARSEGRVGGRKPGYAWKLTREASTWLEEGVLPDVVARRSGISIATLRRARARAA